MKHKNLLYLALAAAGGYYLYKRSGAAPVIAPKQMMPLKPVAILAGGSASGPGAAPAVNQITPDATLAQAAATAVQPATTSTTVMPTQSTLSGTVFSAKRALGSLG